jgi:peroxin-7
VSAACDNFGISGGASLYFLRLEENSFFASKFVIQDSYKFGVSIFDVDWSPVDRSLLLTGNGDGSIAVWRWPLPDTHRNTLPYIKSIQHQKEVYTVEWEPTAQRPYHFMSCSWDKTVKIWNISSGKFTILHTISDHESMVYAASWNPKNIGMMLSVSADKTFRLWDVNSNIPQTNLISSIYASQPNKADILCCDWCKTDPNMFALGYASGLIEIRDVRKPNEPAVAFPNAHDYAIKRIKFSPHLQHLLGTVAYDMKTKLWHPVYGLVCETKNHTEFSYGIDFDPVKSNRLADCGWDRKVVLSEFQL